MPREDVYVKPLDRLGTEIGPDMGPDIGRDRNPASDNPVSDNPASNRPVSSSPVSNSPVSNRAALADVVGMLEGSLAVLDRQGASLAAAHLSMVLDLMRKEIDGPVPPEGIAGIPATIQSTQLH